MKKLILKYRIGNFKTFLKNLVLSLSLEEKKAVRDYYRKKRQSKIGKIGISSDQPI